MSFYDPNKNLPSLSTFGSQKRSVLFLFQPMARAFTDQQHRPLRYRISDDVVMAAREAAHNVNLGQRRDQQIEHVLNSRNALLAALPEENPTVIIGLSQLSATWKFLLVLVGDFPRPGEVGISSPSSVLRTLCFGYCVDEPINAFTLHTGTPTVNPQCQMIITHKTSITELPVAGIYGTVPRYLTPLDVDVLNPQHAHQLSTAELRLVDPLHLSQSSMLTAGEHHDVMFAMPSMMDNLSQQTTPVEIDNVLHHPTDNLRQVMRAAILANQDAIKNEQFTSGSIFDNVPRGDIVTQSMERFFGMGTATAHHSGPDLHTNWTMAELQHRFDPDIIPYDSDRSIWFSAADQGVRHARNVFSSLLCSAIPALMVRAQLLHMSFHYATRSWDTFNPEALEWYEVHPAVPLSGDVLRAKAEAVMQELRTGMFTMMRAARGDFDLHGSFSVANVSHCVLNFLCDSQIINEPFEVPTIFGGLTSTLVADTNTAMENTHQYTQLVGAMTGSEIQDTEQVRPTSSFADTGPRLAGWGNV